AGASRAGLESRAPPARVVRTGIKTQPTLQWVVERAVRAELTNAMATRGAQVGMTQETVLRTLPDSADASAEAGRAETAAAGSAQPKRSAAVTSEADSAPSRLPSDQEIRSTVHEDSPSEGTSDDTGQQ